VEDSVSSFVFQDLSCRANKAYTDALADYQLIQRGERNLIAAGFGSDVQRINNEWAKLETAYNQRNADGYEYVVNNVAPVQSAITTLREEFDQSNQPTSIPTPKATGPDAATIVIVILVLAVGAYGFMEYKKRQDQENEESTQ